MKEKKGLSITVKTMLLVILPICLFGLAAVKISYTSQQSLSYDLISQQLKSVAYNVNSLYALYTEGDYSCQDGKLFKGSEELSSHNQMIDQIKKKSDVNVTVFWNDTRMLTTLLNKKGDRIIGTRLDKEVSDKVLGGEEYFNSDMLIEGTEYCGYYIPLKQTSGKIVGIIFTGKSKVDVDAKVSKNALKLGIIMGAILLFAVICAVLLLRKMMSGLNHAVAGLDSVARDDLTYELNDSILKQKDEIGVIARSVQLLIQSLKGMIHKIKSASDKLSDGSGVFNDSLGAIHDNIEGINQAVEEIAKSASSQADETMAANEKVVRMNQEIAHTFDKVKGLNQSCKRMKDFSVTAEHTMTDLESITGETKQSVEIVHQQTDLTNQSAFAIQSAAELISDIASQTNLLSLNASIEAARAGENGKGFAVVADEIRNLSEQSASSAEKVANIVKNLISNSNTSVTTMETVTANVDLQGDKLEVTKTMFDNLNREITEVTESANQIEEKMNALNSLIEGVSSTVENVAAIAQENAATTEETSASMTELKEIIGKCKEETQALVTLSDSLKTESYRFRIS